MNKHAIIITALSAASALALGGAFVIGVRFGATQSELIQSTVKATLLVGELRALRAGKTEALIRSKELELDGQVYLYQRLLDEGHVWLFWPNSNAFEHERYLRKVAIYRKEFPASMPALEITGTDSTSEEMRKANAQVAKTTEAIVRTYGQ
jgi:hypothetical protein